MTTSFTTSKPETLENLLNKDKGKLYGEGYTKNKQTGIKKKKS